MADDTDLTVADLLTDMSVLANEYDLSSGGADETRAINALNLALRYCYMVAASVRHCLSTSGTGAPYIIQATANQELTAKPTQLLRLDAMWALSTDDNITPIWELQRIDEVGGQRPSLPWPLNWAVQPANGQPFAYYEDQANWYWLPSNPSQNFFMRVYGLWVPAKWAARTDSLNLPGNAAMFLSEPLAAFAVKRMRMSVDDPTDQIDTHAATAFAPALMALRKQDRSRPGSRVYAQTHST